jgi:integrase
VGDVLDAWLDASKARLAAGSVEFYRYRFAAVKGSKLGGLPAALITPKHLEQAAARRDWSPDTRHNTIVAVQTAFKWAASPRVKLLPAYTLSGVEVPAKRSRGGDAVVPDAVHERLSAGSPPALRKMLAVLRETGARPSEIARLTAADVDLDAGVAVLAVHKTARKVRRPRLIYLTPTAAEILRRAATLRPEGPLLVNSAGRRWTAKALANAVWKVRKRIGLPRTYAYGYRHSLATRSLLAGVPDATVAAILGHASTAMVHKHYSHCNQNAKAMHEALKKTFGDSRAEEHFSSEVS